MFCVNIMLPLKYVASGAYMGPFFIHRTCLIWSIHLSETGPTYHAPHPAGVWLESGASGTAVTSPPVHRGPSGRSGAAALIKPAGLFQAARSLPLAALNTLYSPIYVQLLNRARPQSVHTVCAY